VSSVSHFLLVSNGCVIEVGFFSLGCCCCYLVNCLFIVVLFNLGGPFVSFLFFCHPTDSNMHTSSFFYRLLYNYPSIYITFCRSFSRRKKKSEHVRMQQISCTEEKRKMIRKNFCHHFLAPYLALDCTIFPLYPPSSSYSTSPSVVYRKC
jgi:hypothetical protein